MLLLKNLTIVEFEKLHLTPRRALDLLVVCLTNRNPKDYIKKAVWRMWKAIEPATSKGLLTN